MLLIRYPTSSPSSTRIVFISNRTRLLLTTLAVTVSNNLASCHICAWRSCRLFSSSLPTPRTTSSSLLSTTLSSHKTIIGMESSTDITATQTTTTTTPTTTSTETSKQTMSSKKVNILDLAAACIACTETASVAIQTIRNEQTKNSRLKQDGSFVTDADYVAQGVIVQAIQAVSHDITIIGEESTDEMSKHIHQHQSLLSIDNTNVVQRTNYEVRLRYHKRDTDTYPLSSSSESIASSSTEKIPPVPADDVLDGIIDPDECYIDPSRITVVVDPLDGTKSYANSEYDVVSILIGILVDYKPYFGVVGKPFGYTGLPPMLDTMCVTIYGGPLVHGAYVAGQKDSIVPKSLQTLLDDQSNIDELPRAVISSSRSKGVVHDFCIHLSEFGLIHPEPLLISGAGEKSLRVILQRNNEALWFYPKDGTYLWDIAGPDAILRGIGGKITNKYGNDIDYNKSRNDAENIDGVIACINSELHTKCLDLFKQGDWINRR